MLEAKQPLYTGSKPLHFSFPWMKRIRLLKFRATTLKPKNCFVFSFPLIGILFTVYLFLRTDGTVPAPLRICPRNVLVSSSISSVDSKICILDFNEISKLAVHMLHSWGNIHIFANIFCKRNNTVMDQIFSGNQFICSISLGKSAESMVTQGLAIIAGRMKGILVSEIKFAFFKDFIICKTIQLSEDRRPNNNVYRGEFGRELLLSLYGGANIISLILEKIWYENGFAHDLSNIFCLRSDKKQVNQREGFVGTYLKQKTSFALHTKDISCLYFTKNDDENIILFSCKGTNFKCSVLLTHTSLICLKL